MYVKNNHEGKLVQLRRDIINKKKKTDRNVTHFKVKLRQYDHFLNGSFNETL